MSTSRPVFVYDGDCAFCSACVRFMERWVPHRAQVVPYQFADLGALGLTRAACEAAVQWIGADGGVSAGPDAIARLLATSNRPWRLAGAVLRVGVVRRVSWPAYRWVARNRHRLPGGSPACALPAGRAEPAPDGSGQVRDLRGEPLA